MKQPKTNGDRHAEAARPSWYVTTAIPYVNAPPHIGFALEIVQTDVLARYHRAKGYDVRFQTGSDENSLKNVQAAARAGVPVADLVAANARAFAVLTDVLDLSVDDFIRTSADPRHGPGVARLWTACADRGDIYRRAYRGLYCVGCEQFYKPDDLQDGRCPEHGTAPETVAEENYFFRLSRYRDALADRIGSGRLKIVPDTRRNEVLRWIADGLEDFSISRSSGRARGWGLPVPGDPAQVIYVWFDALGNYVTALGYGSDDAAFGRYWRDAAERVHVIGKGITRFHALYWPAMLLSAGLPLPDRILVHGYVTVDGAKIGKSADNAIDPVPIARDVGADALRYYLLRHVRSTADGDFARERLDRAYESELADQLGNLARRTLSMVARYCDGVVPGLDDSDGIARPLLDPMERLPGLVARHIECFALHEAMTAIWDLVAAANKAIADQAPWDLAKQSRLAEEPAVAHRADARLRVCLHDLVAALHVIGGCLGPFLPTTSSRLLRHIGAAGSNARGFGDARPDVTGRRIEPGIMLFPKR